MDEPNNPIRAKLEKICGKFDADKNIDERMEQINEQVSQIENQTEMKAAPLYLRTGSTINQAEEMNVNCHAFSFQFWKSPFYRSVNKYIQDITYGSFSVNNILIELLIEKKIIELKHAEAGCIVLYRDAEKNIKHSGVVINDDPKNIIVESKPGILPVFLHKLWHVHPEYGSEPPEYYSALSLEKAIKFYDVYNSFIQRSQLGDQIVSKYYVEGFFQRIFNYMWEDFQN